MNEQRKGLLLATIALVTLATIWCARVGMFSPQHAVAQESGQPTSPPGTPTSTLTPTPGTSTPVATRSRKVVNEVIAPRSNDSVSGFLSVLGTALITSYRRYDIHISPAGNDEWQWLMTNHDAVRDGILLHFDTNRLPDGIYDIRVRAIADRGNYTETFVRNIEIRNANPPTSTPFVDADGVRQVIVYSPIPTPSATPTPTSESRVAGGRGLYAPGSGSIVRGYVPVIATVNGDRYFPFDRYELAISAAGAENWQFLHSGEQQYWQDEVYQLDTRLFADGFYDLRLRNIFKDGNYGEYFVRNLQFVNNFAARPATQPGITSPRSGSSASDIVDFRGTAMDPNFLRWELHWSAAGEENWSFLVSSERPVENDLLARLNLSELPQGAYDFKLRVVRQDHNYNDYYLRDLQITAPIPTQVPTPTSTAVG